MRDRQVFDTYKLENGWMIYDYKTNDPFVLYSITIPIGTVHSGILYPSGTTHFYEHIVMNRSKMFLKSDEFQKWVTGVGGSINAVTELFHTTFHLQVPHSYAKTAWEGMYSMLFETIFDIDDIEKEKNIIINERQQQRWYPGITELSHYLWTKWIDGSCVSKNQMYGSDEDLNSISLETIKKFSSEYNASNCFAIVAGATDASIVIRSLSQLNTTHKAPVEKYLPPIWKNKEFHTFEFQEIDSPMYFIGSIYNLPTNQERIAISFILDFLTHQTDGVLLNWLRREKGWTYSVNYTRVINQRHEVVMIEMSLHNKEQVKVIREEIQDHVVEALKNPDNLKKAVIRRVGEMIFHYQTLETIMSDAIHDIVNYKEPLSEKQFIQYTELCQDSTYILNVYNKFFSKTSIGEFCALPLP